MAQHEKAAGDHASGQSRVRKRIRVEISPALVGPCSIGKPGSSMLKMKHRNRDIQHLPSDRGGAATLVRDAEVWTRQPAVGAVAVIRPVRVAAIECRRRLAGNRRLDRNWSPALPRSDRCPRSGQSRAPPQPQAGPPDRVVRRRAPEWSRSVPREGQATRFGCARSKPVPSAHGSTGDRPAPQSTNLSRIWAPVPC